MKFTMKWKKFKKLTKKLQTTLSRAKSQSVIRKSRISKRIKRIKSVVQSSTIMI